MIGIFFLLTIVAWLSASLWLAIKVGNFVPGKRSKTVAKLMILAVALASPFMDEVIGEHQFRSLCETNGIESVDVSKARGMRLKLEYGERKLVGRTVIPIKRYDVILRDAENGAVVLTYQNYSATGGWVMRYTWLGLGTHRPMLFGGSTCNMRLWQKIFRANSITLD